MEDNRHPIFEEEESVGMVSEPIGTAVATETCLVDDVDENLDWDKFPSMGPFSEEEAIARIDKFEEELAKGEVKWMRIDDIHSELKKLHPWL